MIKKITCGFLVVLLGIFVINAGMPHHAKIYVAGHGGFLGCNLMNVLKKSGFSNLIQKTSEDLDLRDQKAVMDFFEKERPEYVFLTAARVGGIKFHINHEVDFLYDNLMIACNVIHAAYKMGVKKLLYISSSAVYPKKSDGPIDEKSLLSGTLDSSIEYYALAKLIGIKLCEAYGKQHGMTFISCVPPNFYGPTAYFDKEKAHVVPALINRFYEAKQNNKSEVVVWGTGNARREFIYVEDLAYACIFLMNTVEESMYINVGVGKDVSIRELAETIQNQIGFKGKLVFDVTKPEGTMKRLLNNDEIKQMGWEPQTSFKKGIQKTINWFLKQQETF